MHGRRLVRPGFVPDRPWATHRAQIKSEHMIPLQRMLELTPHGGHPNAVTAATIGLFVAASVERGAPLSAPLAWYLERLHRAAELHQIKFYFDRFGRYCGHVWWTHAPASCELVLLRQGPDGLAASNFSSEGDAWILDFGAQFGALASILVDMRDNVLAHGSTLTYFRYKRNHRMAKRISRENRASFLKRRGDASIPCHDALTSDHDLLFLAASVAEKYIHLGMTLMLFGQQSRFAQMPLARAFHRIRHPLELGQYRLLVSPDQVPMGFYSWAWLDATENAKAGFRPLDQLDASEWNEGRELFLCDAIATLNGKAAMLDEMVNTWYAGEALYFYPPMEDSTSAAGVSLLMPCQRDVLLDLSADTASGLDVIAGLLSQESATC